MSGSKASIEAVSASTVFYRFFGGLAAILVALLYEPIARDQTIQLIVIAIGVLLAISAWRLVANPRLAIKYHLNPGKTVADLIRQWTPHPARLESEYEKSLHHFLKAKLPFEKITRQYGAGRVKCDLAVGSRVMIELKNGLRSTNKLQRLLGQLELYRREWSNPIILVLLGESEEDLLHDLNRSLQGYGSVEVIAKPASAPAEDEQAQAEGA